MDVMARECGHPWAATGAAGQIGPVDRFEPRTPRAWASGRWRQRLNL